MSELTVGQLRGLTINNNIVTVPSGHKLYAPGHVLQVVTATTATPVSTTSGTFISAGLSASITPTFASSRIVVMAQTAGLSPNANTVAVWTLFRGTVAGTNLGNGSQGMAWIYITLNNELRAPVSCMAVDSPNTISSQTYTLGVRGNGSGTVTSQPASELATMILMEIAS
jgi:hypothetical protein